MYGPPSAVPITGRPPLRGDAGQNASMVYPQWKVEEFTTVCDEGRAALARSVHNATWNHNSDHTGRGCLLVEDIPGQRPVRQPRRLDSGLDEQLPELKVEPVDQHPVVRNRPQVLMRNRTREGLDL